MANKLINPHQFACVCDERDGTYSVLRCTNKDHDVKTIKTKYGRSQIEVQIDTGFRTIVRRFFGFPNRAKALEFSQRF